MGNSFRAQPLPTQYPAQRSAVTEDVLQVGLAYAAGIIAVSFILIIPGIRGWERLWAMIRVLTALKIGTVILMCNFGTWYAGKICTTTQYKAHTLPNSNPLIEATIGIALDLRGFNITLIEMENGCEGSEKYIRPFPGEQIYYIERFQWAPSWRQGIQDYGKYGGQIHREYRAAQYRGLPYPIMRVAEYFLLDGEQIVWQKKFKFAGWYTHILMWLAFATYLYSILLFLNNIRYGAYFMLMTGCLLIMASFTYALQIQNDPPFKIPFPNGILRPTFSFCFYMTAITGVLTAVMAGMVLLMNYLNPRMTSVLFHHTYIKDDTMLEGDVEEEDDDLSHYLHSKRNEVSANVKRVIKLKRESRRNSIVSRKNSILSYRASRRRKRSSSYRQAQSLGMDFPEVPSATLPCDEDKTTEDQCNLEMMVVQVTMETDVDDCDDMKDQEVTSRVNTLGVAKGTEQETDMDKVEDGSCDIQQMDETINQVDIEEDNQKDKAGAVPIITTI